MVTKSLDNEIIKSLSLLGKKEKQSILNEIKSFLKLKEKTIKHNERISIEEYNKEGHDAMARVLNGQFYTHEEVEKMSKKW